MSRIDGNWADAEWSHDALAADDRPRVAVRNGWTWEQYDDAAQDTHTYDPSTGGWS